MASSTAPPDEAKEILLIDKVELRIASTNTNTKLSDLLKVYLAPLLLKLASPHAQVRAKVVKFCQHISLRAEAPDVQLPVEALLKLYKEHSDSSLIKYYAITYAQKGLRRLPPSARSDLLPILLNQVEKSVGNVKDVQAAKYFHILLIVLQTYILPSKGSNEDNQLREALTLRDEDVEYLARWFGRIILFRPVANPNPSTIPGLHQEEIDFFTVQNAPDAWKPGTELGLSIIEVKKQVLSFMSSAVFEDRHRLVPALHAAGDPNPTVIDRGDEMLKKINAEEVFSQQPDLIVQLYKNYVGEEGIGAPSAALPSLKVKILTILARSPRSAAHPAFFARIVEDTLRNPDAMDIDEGPGAKPKKQGLESAKLRTAVFTFTNFFLRHATPEEIKTISDELMASFRDFIESQGWPTPAVGEDHALRQSAYETLGAIAKIVDDRDMDLIGWYFHSLLKDESGREVTMAIENGLSNLIGIFARAPTAVLEDSMNDGDVGSANEQRMLAQLLLKNVSQSTSKLNGRRTKYAALRFANRCLPFSNVIARRINAYALADAGDADREIIEEARKGLDPWWFKLTNAESPRLWTSGRPGHDDEFAFPSFSALCRQLFDIDEDEGTYNEGMIATIRRELGDATRDHPRQILLSLDFCRQILAQTALQRRNMAPALSPDWKRKVLTAAFDTGDGRTAVKEYMRSLSGRDLLAVDAVLQAALLSWKQAEITPGLECESAFVDLLACAPATFLDKLGYSALYVHLAEPLKSSNPLVRTAAARSFGILYSLAVTKQATSLEALQAMLTEVAQWGQASVAQYNAIAGSIEACGFATPRLTRLSQGEDDSVKAVTTLFQELMTKVLEKTTDSTLLNATFSSLGQAGIFRTLPAATITSLVDKIAAQAMKGNEKAIIALGRVSVSLGGTDDEGELLETIRKKLRECHEVRQLEAQFAVGEALAILASAWDCSTLSRERDIDGLVFTTESRPQILEDVLESTIADCKASKPALRKAAVIWLLSLVQFCGDTPQIKSSLRKCQAAFKGCLSDRDELVQEAASRGLGFVYEKGDRELKDTLVRDLVGSFTGDKANMGEVTEDTQLFEEGALPTGDGSVTSYKDILSLAAEVGNPSLVYRFMSLAANNAIWSSRAAFGRFGLSNVFSDSAVDGYLAENPKLYPKLYRYQFDPNTNVQRSMKDIWTALVKDTNKTLETHFDAIMEDLLQSIISKEWRVRQASCAAVGDLVQGRKLEVYEKYLADIWKKCFMVLDDIKGSVQQAAHGLARILSNILLRSLEAGEGSAKSSTKMLENVLPFLKSNAGLGSKADNVRVTAVKTLIDIINKASAKVLRPFIPELIELLIGQLSELEGQGVEYLRMKASEYKLTTEQIDEFRTKALRGSAPMVAIDRCLALVDEESMSQVALTLENQIKTGIALPSKVGCSTILVTLSTRHRLLFASHADRFMTIMQKAVQDRNDTVCNAYANSAGYIARIASDTAILKWSAFAQKLYMDSEDDRGRFISADCVAAVAKHASDRFSNLASDFVPFIFIAKHDDAEHVKTVLNNTWDDSVGGSRSVMLYLKEIMSMATGMLDSPKWSLKHTAARAISGAVDACISGLGADGISDANARTIWPALEKAVGGKTWDGKEVVILAFAKYVQKTSSFWSADKTVATQIKKTIVREARRNNHTYQIHALPALADVVTARNDLDMTEDVFDTVTSLIESLTEKQDKDAMDVDGGEALKDDDLKSKLLCGALKASAASLRTGLITQDTLTSFVEICTKVAAVQNPKVALQLFESLKAVFERITSTVTFKSTAAEEKVLEQVKILLFQQVYNGYAEAVRKARAEAVLALSKSAWTGAKRDEKIREALQEEISADRSLDVKRVLEEAKKNMSES